MTELPEYLKQGDDARLIPACRDSNVEARLLSPVLAAMVIVPEFAKVMLGPLGIRIGKTTKIRALTEIVFSNDDFRKERPDGLIILSTGSRETRILIEAKAKNNDLDAEQIEKYAALAKAEKIDAVLTISNNFTANPHHSPVKIKSTLLRHVDLYHLSWSMVTTNVDLLLGMGNVEDKDRASLMRELQRFLAHKASGVSGFTQMNRGWRDVVKAFSSGALPRKGNPAMAEAIAAWHQEQKDMCLILSRDLQRHVRLKLPRKHRESADTWRADATEELLSSNCLRSGIEVPDAVAPMAIEANLARKNLVISLKVRAPEDKKSARARSNWLLRQLHQASDPRLQVRFYYPGKKPHTTRDLSALREKPELANDGSGIAPNYLELRLHDELGADFSGSKKFIERLEKNFLAFYVDAVAGIKNWQPSAPQPVDKPLSAEITPAVNVEKPATRQLDSPGDLN